MIMYRGRSRVLPIILVIIIAVVAIIALVSLGKAMLNRGGQATVVEDDHAQQSLLVSEIDRSVRMRVRGPIQADEKFHSYQITISPTSRNLTTYEGFNNRVIKSENFTNSTAGYEEFVHALAKLNFADTVQPQEGLSDVRGVCATGRLYTFEMLQAQSIIESSWIASCRDAKGSFRGNAVAVRDLFQRQIPDASSLLRGLNL